MLDRGGRTGRLMRIPSGGTMLLAPHMLAGALLHSQASVKLNYPNGCWPWRIWRWAGVGSVLTDQVNMAAYLPQIFIVNFRADGGDFAPDSVGNGLLHAD